MTAPSIKQATPADAGAALAILLEADRWIQSRGLRQWGHYLDGSGEADLRAAIDRGEVHLFCVDGRPAGTLSLQLAPTAWDLAVWGAVAPDEAIYIHRLALDRAYAGTGLGGQMLDWAERQAAAAGRRLRLDCVAENEGLNRYYRRRFAFKGTGENGGRRFSLYEKPFRKEPATRRPLP